MAARVSSSTRPAPLPQLPATCSPARGWCRSSWQRSAICATSSESSAQHRRQLSSAASGLSAQHSQPQQLLQKHQANLSPRISRCTPSACRHLAARAAPGITALSAVLSLAFCSRAHRGALLAVWQQLARKRPTGLLQQPSMPPSHCFGICMQDSGHQWQRVRSQLVAKVFSPRDFSKSLSHNTFMWGIALAQCTVVTGKLRLTS